MKHAITTGLLCLLIGIAIGWIAKPGRSTEIASNDPGHHPATAQERGAPTPGRETPGQKSDRPITSSRTVVIGGNKELSDEQRKVIEDSQNQMEKMMIERQRKKFDRRIADLVRKLDLNPAQEAALKKLYEEKLAGLGGLLTMNSLSDIEQMKTISALLRGDALDEETTALLDADQLEAYETMKAEDRSRKMDAKALKDLSKLTGVLELSPDQKDAVYEVLYEQAADKIDNPSDASLLMSLSMEGMGIEYDIEDSGIGEAITMQMETGGGGEVSQADMIKHAREQAAQRIDNKVALLANILDEDQSARYREHLESKNQNLFGGMMIQGLETEHDTTIHVPAGAE